MEEKKEIDKSPALQDCFGSRPTSCCRCRAADATGINTSKGARVFTTLMDADHTDVQAIHMTRIVCEHPEGTCRGFGRERCSLDERQRLLGPRPGSKANHGSTSPGCVSYWQGRESTCIEAGFEYAHWLGSEPMVFARGQHSSRRCRSSLP